VLLKRNTSKNNPKHGRCTPVQAVKKIKVDFSDTTERKIIYFDTKV